MIEPKEFASIEEKYVVMMDTLGQDRQFSTEEKRFILQTVQRFIELWEKQENSCLVVDRDNKLELMQVDKLAEAEAYN